MKSDRKMKGSARMGGEREKGRGVNQWEGKEWRVEDGSLRERSRKGDSERDKGEIGFLSIKSKGEEDGRRRERAKNGGGKGMRQLELEKEGKRRRGGREGRGRGKGGEGKGKKGSEKKGKAGRRKRRRRRRERGYLPILF